MMQRPNDRITSAVWRGTASGVAPWSTYARTPDGDATASATEGQNDMTPHQRSERLSPTSATSHLRDGARDRVPREIGHQVAAQIVRIIARAVDETRLAPAQERDTHQIQARNIGHTLVVTDMTFTIQHWDFQPGIVGTKAGCPHDGPDLTTLEIDTERR